MATTGPDPEDLTARARIREAAMLHFGERGFEGATIREIAKTAGVSSGLVRHHFGSKQALREACEEHLVKMIRRLNDQIRADTTTGDPSHAAAVQIALRPYQRYVARVLSEGGAARLFDHMTRMTEEWIKDADRKRPDPPDVPPGARATVITAMALSITVLHQHVARGLGVDLFSPDGGELLARALIDIYSHPLISLEEAAAYRAGLDRARHQSPAEHAAVFRRMEEYEDE